MKRYLKKAAWAACMAFVFILTFGKGADVSAAETNLPQKQWVSGVIAETSAGNTYYKINISKTGYIKAEYIMAQEPDFFSKIALYDGRKKKLSESSSIEQNHTAYWAVKKGTYYLRTENASERVGVGEPDEDGDYSQFAAVSYRIRYTFTAEKNKGKKATKMSKAPELKKGKTAKGLVFPKDKDGVRAVYKVNITKTGKVRFHFKIKSSYFLSSALQVRLYDAKGRLLTNGKYKKNMIYWYESEKTKVNLKEGTYYLGIYKFNSDGSGFYSIQWK